MDQFTEKLTEIMHKIAFKVPWQRLKLSEDELRALDTATGEQMVDIAYKNRIPFSRFIHHADELINEFNESKFKQYLKDVKELNKALAEPFKCAVTKDIQIEPVLENDPLARERELMEAAIEEFLDGRLSDENLITQTLESGSGNFLQDEKFREFQEEQNAQGAKVDDALSRTCQTLKFVDGINFHNTLGGSISFQRRELEPSNYQMNANFGEDLPIPSLDELAELGVLEGETGRKIFNNIVEQENRNQNEVRRTDEIAQLEVAPELARISDIENMNVTPQVEPPKDISNVEQSNIVPDIELPPPQVERSLTPLAVDSRSSTRESYAERIARLEQVPDIDLNQLGAKTNAEKPKRKAPRVRRVKKAVEDLEIVRFLKPLVLKRQKKLHAKKRKNPNVVDVYAENLDLNFLDEVQHNLIEYDIPPAEYIDEAINAIPEFFANPQVVPMEVNPIEEKQAEKENSNQKRAIASPELVNVSKRPRIVPQIEETIPEIPLIDQSAPQIMTTFPEFPLPDQSAPQIMAEIPEIPFVDQSVPQMPQISSSFDPSIDLAREACQKSVQVGEVPIIATSLKSNSTSTDSSFKAPLPKGHRTTAILQQTNQFFKERLNLKPTANTITTQDILYEGLVRNRANTFTPQSNDITPNEPIPHQFIQEEDEKYERFKDQFSGVEKIKFENKRGKMVVYDEINIQNMLLYMQIRKYMKMHKKTSLNAEEFKKHFKLPHTKKDFVLVNRLTQLVDKGLLLGVWNDDPTAYMADVLIEIKLPNKEQDKENVP